VSDFEFGDSRNWDSTTYCPVGDYKIIGWQIQNYGNDSAFQLNNEQISHRHNANSSTNLGFCDGHVSTMRTMDIFLNHCYSNNSWFWKTYFWDPLKPR